MHGERELAAFFMLISLLAVSLLKFTYFGRIILIMPEKPIPITCTGLGLLVLLVVTVFATPAPGQADPSGVTWDKRIEVASGDAYQGRWRMNESEFRYVDDPTVAINEQGDVGVAWTDQSQKDIFFQLYAANGEKRLKEPVNISRSPGIFSWLPRMVTTSSDPSSVYILWQEIVFLRGYARR